MVNRRYFVETERHRAEKPYTSHENEKRKIKEKINENEATKTAHKTQ